MSGRLHVLNCRDFRVQFTDRGSLARLEPAFSNRSVLEAPRRKPLSPFRIVRRSIHQWRGGRTYSAENFAIRLTWESMDRLVFEGNSSDGSLGITEVAQVTPEGSLRWKLQLTNRRGGPVWLVAFPVLSALSWKPGQRITIPHNSGFSLDPRELEKDEEIFLNYPVHASMQWIDLYTRDEGLYLGIHDELAHVKQFAISQSEGRVRIEWRYPDVLLRAGETWAVPAATIVLHRGDWHSGADLYRKWAATWIEFPEPPQWFERLPAWSWLSGKGNYALAPRRRFRDLPAAVSLLRRETGVPVVQFAGWMEHGHDTHYPDYVPGECMGGGTDLAFALGEIHRRGQRLSLYTNGRLIDPEGSVGGMLDWQRFCVRLAPCSRENAGYFLGTFTTENQWDPDGDIAKEKYGRTLFAVACPHQKDWQNLFIDRILRLVRTYPIDGLYLDQVCGATCLPCYASDHGHPRPNLAWRGYVDLLGNLRDAVKGLRPELYLATEGVGDVFGQFFDAQQAHNDWVAQIRGKGEDMCDLFRYTFPESLDLIGPTPPNQEKYLRLGLAVAGGFDCFDIFPRKSTREFRVFMKRTLALRRQLFRFIRGTHPLADVSVRGTGAKVFGLEAEGHVLITGGWEGRSKPKKKEWVVRFRPRGGTRFRTANLWLPERITPAWRIERGAVAFRVPFARIFAAVFRRK